MVPSKALLVCLVFGLCFVVISSEVTARELADKTHDKTNSVEHTTPTKEVKTEANGVQPDYYYYPGGGYYPPYHRPYYPPYHRPYYPPYRGGYGGHYPPERKTQESTSTENPDYYTGGGYYHPHPYYPYRPPYYRPPYGYRGGYGGRYPPGEEN